MKKNLFLISSLTLVLISLVSCNSGGSSSSTAITPVNNTVSLIVDGGINHSSLNRSYHR